MITDSELARACFDAYNDTQAEGEFWDIGGVAFLHRQIGSDHIIAFRGSKVLIDWFRNFRAIPLETVYGHVHAGFYDGLPTVLTNMRQNLGDSIYVTGHSLGAARAPIFARMLEAAGLAPKACVMFAPPRPGFEDFRDGLALSGVPLRSYRNAGDPVPDVPLTLLPFLPWAHVAPLRSLAVTAPDADREPLRAHHMALYQQGIEQLKGVTA